MTDYDLSIHINPDAMAWADFFDKTFPTCNVPKDVMYGWFCNAMTAMHDYLTGQGAGACMSDWRDASDTPEPGSMVLTYGVAKNGAFFSDAMFDGNGEWLLFHPEFDAYCVDFTPSHWMPLPAPPITNPDSAPTPPE